METRRSPAEQFSFHISDSSVAGETSFWFIHLHVNLQVYHAGKSTWVTSEGKWDAAAEFSGSTWIISIRLCGRQATNQSVWWRHILHFIRDRLMTKKRKYFNQLRPSVAMMLTCNVTNSMKLVHSCRRQLLDSDLGLYYSLTVPIFIR